MKNQNLRKKTVKINKYSRYAIEDRGTALTECKIIDFIKEHFLRKDFGLFLVIGCVNTINGTLLSFLFSVVLQANIAFVAGYMASLTTAYFLNIFIVFHNKPQWLKYMRFMISYIPNFIIQNTVVIIFYNILHVNKLLTYMLAAAIGIPVTFLLLKLFAFKTK